MPIYHLQKRVLKPGQMRCIRKVLAISKLGEITSAQLLSLIAVAANSHNVHSYI